MKNLVLECFWHEIDENNSALKKILQILLLLVYGFGFAQIPQKDSLVEKEIQSDYKEIRFEKKDSTDLYSQFFDDSDSLVMDRIQLDEVQIVAPFKFDNRDDRREYFILKRKTQKVWPYVVLAADRLEELRARLDVIDNKYGKKVYTQRVQNYMEEQFTEQLKKLTKTEGQILVKLLYRQTGETTYDVVQDLRNGWRAFRYNVTAGIFTISLKEEYNPLNNKEDFFIEHILRRGFQMDDLEYQDPKIDLDFSMILEKWENELQSSLPE